MGPVCATSDSTRHPTPRMSTAAQDMCFQDLEGVCREAGKQAHDWAASVRSMAELADQTGYAPSSGHNRSLVAIIAEKRERNRCRLYPLWHHLERRHVLCHVPLSARQFMLIGKRHGVSLWPEK